MYVNFFANGTITVTTGDGTSVGSSSGAPTVIPAGYYTLEFSGPGGCSMLPYFHLNGPGTSIVTNGEEGQVVHPPGSANFLPSSTYTWSDDDFPGVIYQFSTSSEVLGSPPAAPTSATSGSRATVSSQDVVGSAPLPFVGSLSGTIGAGGKVALLHDGKPVTSLKPGRYTITIVSKSPSSGFVIEQTRSRVVALSRGSFTGKRSISVSLTAGQWTFMATPGNASFVFLVG